MSTGAAAINHVATWNHAEAASTKWVKMIKQFSATAASLFSLIVGITRTRICSGQLSDWGREMMKLIAIAFEARNEYV